MDDLFELINAGIVELPNGIFPHSFSQTHEIIDIPPEEVVDLSDCHETKMIENGSKQDF